MRHKLPILFLLSLSFLAHGAAASAQDVRQMSMQDLLEIDITSVSKKKEKAVDAAAALFVLTSEDIRRSGAKTIPDALRMVPGVYVAQYNSYSWSVSMRGFPTLVNNKLLVLIDGRSIYAPIFGGVTWEAQDTEIEHIERIEVIRGPGATMWGANAVDGVINIITKSAWDTNKDFITAGGGSHEEGFATISHGDTLGEDSAYRTFVKWFNRGSFDRDDGEGTAKDSWWGLRGGGRIDSSPSDKDELTFSSEVFHHEENQLFNFGPITSANFPEEDRKDNQHHGAFLLGNWTRTISEDSQLQVKSYYDFLQQQGGLVGVRLHTFDFETQHRFSPLENHDVVWGAGFRQYWDDTDGTFVIDFDPDDRNYNRFNIFVQDEWEFIEDTASIVFGAKLEHNTFTDYDFQPNLRLAWHPAERTTLWGAVSRAVRVPSRGEQDAHFVYSELVDFDGAPDQIGGLPALVTANGSRDMDSEKLTAYEIGLRRQFSETLFGDVTGYYNVYDDHASFETSINFINDPVPLLNLDSTADNRLSAENYGVEVAGEWRPKRSWRLLAWYNYSQGNFYGSDTTDSTEEGGIPIVSSTSRSQPIHQAGLRSLLNVTESIEFDSMMRYVNGREGFFRAQDDRYELDLRVAWRPRPDIELSVAGRNLLRDSQFEWNEALFDRPPVAIDRSVYGQIRWKF